MCRDSSFTAAEIQGGAPLVWAMINGERSAGTTLFFMDGGVDSGDIIAQRRFKIFKTDTIADVYKRANENALQMLEESLPLLEQGAVRRVPQDDSKATHFPQRFPEDGLINWSKPVSDIKNFIRAQTRPYPGAFTRINGKKVVIWDADIY